MSNLSVYRQLAQAISLRDTRGNYLFSLHTSDDETLDLAEVTEDLTVTCMSLSSPGDSMTSIWVVGPWGCMVFPEVSVNSDISELCQSFVYHRPTVYESADQAVLMSLAST
jgi:hypothetical protein